MMILSGFLDHRLPADLEKAFDLGAEFCFIGFISEFEPLFLNISSCGSKTSLCYCMQDIKT